MGQDMPVPEAEVLLRHVDFIRGLARSLVRDDHTADDVVQDTLLAAVESTSRPRNLRAWLAVVARNIAFTGRRTETRRAARERRAGRPEQLPSVDEGVARLELQRRVVEAVLDLEEPYRSVVVHRFFYSLKLKAIAARLQVPLETVRTRQRRALEQLRQRLDREHGGDRRACSMALLAFVEPARAGFLATAMGGALVMATKLKIAAALVLVAGLAWLLTTLDWNKPAAPRAARTEEATAVQIQPGDSPDSLTRSDFRAVDRDRDLHGVVVDATGTPIAGATVQAIRFPFLHAIGALSPTAWREEAGPSTQSASDGSFFLRLDRGEEVTVRVRADGFAPLDCRWCVAGGRVRIELPEGVPLTVRVVDTLDTPVVGVQVGLWKSMAAPLVEAGGHPHILQASTGADGRCQFERVLPGRKKIMAWHEKFGFPPLRVEVEATMAADVELRAIEGREITGYVSDSETGHVLAGATISPLPVPWGKQVTSGTDGRFVYPGWDLEAGWGGHLYAKAGEYAVVRETVGDRTRVDFRLSKGARVTGILVDTAGSPVAGALVVAIASAGKDIDIREAWSDAEGRFGLDGLRRDLPHTLVVRKPGFGRYLLDFAATVDLGTILVPPAQRIEGRVLEADGSPLTGLTVELKGSNTGRDRLLKARAQKRYGTEDERRTDDLGRFRFVDVAAGRYTVTARREDGRRLPREVTLEPGKDVLGLELRYASEGELAVNVVDPRGDPVVDALVVMGMVQLRTDADGRVRIPLEPGIPMRPVFVAVPEEHRLLSTPAPIEHRPAYGELRVVLQEGTALAGCVLDPEGKPLGPLVLRWRATRGRNGAALVDGQGNFSARVPAGETVDIRLDGEGKEGWIPFVGEAKGVAAGRTDVAVRTRRIETNRTLTVRAVEPDGTGIEGLRVHVNPRVTREQPPPTDAEGRIVFTGLPAVEVNVSMRRGFDQECWARLAAPRESSLKLVPAGQEVVFAFREPNPIRGVLLSADGVGVPGSVMAHRGPRNVVAWGMAKQDGSFVVNVAAEETEPVRLEVHARSVTGDKKVFKAVLEDVSPGTDGVRLQLREQP